MDVEREEGRSETATSLRYPLDLQDVFWARTFERDALVSLDSFEPGRDTALERWLALEAQALNHEDRKTQAAFLIGRISWSLCVLTAACRLEERALPHAPAHIHLAPELYEWRYKAMAGQAVRYRLAIDPPLRTLDPRPTGGDLAQGLVLWFSPLVEVLTAHTGFSRGALWRLVADSVAGGFLSAGRQLGREDEAVALGRAVLGAPTRLANTRSGYVHIARRQAETGTKPAREIFAVRGGCCRYYTVPGGQTCATCVLRTPDTRDALLRDSLRAKGTPIAAR